MECVDLSEVRIITQSTLENEQVLRQNLELPSEITEGEQLITKDTRTNQLIEWIRALDEPESEYFVSQYPILKRFIEIPFINALL